MSEDIEAKKEALKTLKTEMKGWDKETVRAKAPKKEKEEKEDNKKDKKSKLEELISKLLE